MMMVHPRGSAALNFESGFAKLTSHRRPETVVELAGGASARRYFRVSGAGHRFVVMVLAPEPIRSEEAVSGPTPTELPFLEIQRLLRDGGVPVPMVHRYDQEQGLLWLDDLGDEVLLDRLLPAKPTERRALYQQALSVLARFQAATDASGPQICHARRFEPALLRWELDHYLEWRVETQLRNSLSAAQRQALEQAFDALVDELTALPHQVIHRDFQSTNLMWTAGGLKLIDFQDAMVGPYIYDLVALLRDSYVTLTIDEVEALLEDFCALKPALDLAAVRRDFHLQTVQRKLKDAGRFVYIERVKHDDRYLGYIDPSLGYVRDALQRSPSLEKLYHLLGELDPALR